MRKRVNLFPDEAAKSTYRIDYRRYYEEGYRGIIYDIDNTLVPHDAPADERAVRLFRRLKKIGFSFALVSNNEAPRVELFNEMIGAEIVCKAGKPLPRGYEEAMALMGTGKENTLVIGDQLFTDIWGANRCGLRSILVNRIAFREPKHIYLKRLLEAPFLLVWTLFFRREAYQIPEQIPESKEKEEKKG